VKKEYTLFNGFKICTIKAFFEKKKQNKFKDKINTNKSTTA
jgi:hypothetical protein